MFIFKWNRTNKTTRINEIRTLWNSISQYPHEVKSFPFSPRPQIMKTNPTTRPNFHQIIFQNDLFLTPQIVLMFV